MQIAFVTLALACLAVATPTRRTKGASCNTGNDQCCQNIENSKHLNSSTTKLLGSLGIVIQELTGNVGITCNPITAIGTGSNSCTQQTVCCSNNQFNGVVALGCTPVNAGI